MTNIFSDFDFDSFWDNNEYSKQNYIGANVSDEQILSVEKELDYKLPRSYIELIRIQNGGTPNFTNHRIEEATSWANDHVAITGIYGIDRNLSYSLCGELGSQFRMEEWGYPEIGIYFCDCPSAGHDMICLDYRKCGPQGEPEVVHVDQELGYKITVVAKNFESFIRGLERNDNFE